MPPTIPPALLRQIALASTVSARKQDPLSVKYRFRPEEFLRDELNVQVYDGFTREIVRDVAVGWLHGHARESHARGKNPEATCRMFRSDLPIWEPGQPVVNTFVLQGGSGLGKSVLVAGLLLWALRVSQSFSGVVYAPFVDQAYRTTWRYLDAFIGGSWEGAKHRQFANMLEARKGRESDPSIELGALRSVSTKAVNKGSSRIQGQHVVVGSGEVPSASVHVFEEADGIEDRAVFDAVRTMTGKGVSLWFCCLNPATPTAPVQDLRGPSVRRYELSVLDHPNVVSGRDIIPGASNREFVEGVLGDWAREVSQHDPRAGTFRLKWIPGRIFAPLPPWYYRILGQVPPVGGSDSAVPEAIFLAASRRDWRAVFTTSSPVRGTLGVDVARSEAGHGDAGVIAQRWRGCVRVTDRIREKDTRPYVTAIVQRLQEMSDGGCQEVEVRIDAGGGFGGGVRDQLADHSIGGLFRHFAAVLHDFGGRPQDPRKHKDWITGAYQAVGEVLQTHALVEPSGDLRQDLCGRKLRWGQSQVSGSSVDVLYLQPKKEFRQERGRSPDDGDAVALACSPWVEFDGSFEAYDERRWGGSEKSTARSHESDMEKTPWESGEYEDPFEQSLRWNR